MLLMLFVCKLCFEISHNNKDHQVLYVDVQRYVYTFQNVLLLLLLLLFLLSIMILWFKRLAIRERPH